MKKNVTQLCLSKIHQMPLKTPQQYILFTPTNTNKAEIISGMIKKK